MKWRRTRQHDRETVVRDPLVVTVTEPVTRDTAPELVTRLGRMAVDAPVVVDLTAIPSFDSTGAEALVGLQETLGPDRMLIVGLRQAAARLTGDPEPTPTRPETVDQWVLRRLRAIVVVHPADTEVASTDHLEPSLTRALEAQPGIVVVDLRGAQLTPTGIQAIAFASSAAALRGQELLVVNADTQAAATLKAAGLSSTTYVAPEPLPDF